MLQGVNASDGVLAELLENSDPPAPASHPPAPPPETGEVPPKSKSRMRAWPEYLRKSLRTYAESTCIVTEDFGRGGGSLTLEGVVYGQRVNPSLRHAFFMAVDEMPNRMAAFESGTLE